MRSDTYLRTFSEFFLDGAKIIFGSVVIGAFVPNVSAPISWLTFLVGTIATVFFLVISATITTRTINAQKI